MNEYGEIIELKKDEAVIMVKRSSACGKCGSCQMSSNQDKMLLTIPNLLKGEVGDYVELELSSAQVLKASAITYLIPLGALILGVAGGYIISPRFGLKPDLIAALLGISLTAISFLGIRAMEPIFKKGHNFSPQMINITKNIRKGEDDNGE